MEKKIIIRPFHLFLLFLIVLFCVLEVLSGSKKADYTYEAMMTAIDRNEVAAVYVYPGESVPNGRVEVKLKDGKVGKFNDTNVDETVRAIREKGAEVSLYIEEVEKGTWLPALLIFAVAGVLLILFMLIRALRGAGTNPMSEFAKNPAQRIDPGTGAVTFADVAGLEEEKQELQEIVSFLKDPGTFTRLGARIPKGVLLVGPPGTGKTLLAKAVAGEAGVPFFSLSGSDFVEMYVGVGASRVRDLFAEAKANAPAIIFIDEIDAVARKRGAGLGGGHDEREQTLNQMLVEMDGFGYNEGIIVMAATNRVDILDRAILRPGRFDRKVAVSMPDLGGRRAIIGVHSKNKPLRDDVDLDELSRSTIGFSGADLENLMNEAAIRAAKSGSEVISKKDIDEAFLKVSVGTEKKSRVLTKEERRITAYHEAGHAILFHLLPHLGPVHIVSIIPTGIGAAGYTMPLPDKDDVHMTKTKMTEDIMATLGGRIAEELVFDDITTGASQDLKMATSTARAMVTKYGFSDKLGTVSYEESEEVFIGRDFEKTTSYSEKTAAMIDEEIRDIIDRCYAGAKEILASKRDKLDSCAALLLEKEKIDRKEFEALFA